MEDKEQADKKLSADDLKKQIQTQLGQQLRVAREHKEITITDVSAKLRISEVYLQGLESGDWSKLPEEVYVLGFLRQYSALLGKDFHEDIEALKSGEYHLTKPFTIPDPPIAPSKMWAMTAGILFVLLFILFNAVDDDGDHKMTPPETPVASTNPIPGGKSVAKERLPEATAKMNTTPAEQPSEPSSAPDSPSTDINAEALPQTEQKSSPPAISENPLETHSFHLMAVDASVWLQVYTPSGTLLKEALLHPGQSLRLKSSEPFLSVTCGNAAALEIEVDGTLYAAAGTLGAPEKVLHDFKIEVSGHAN